jgi:hypothetical protein
MMSVRRLFKKWMTYKTDPLGSKMPQRHNTDEAAGHACGLQDRDYEMQIFNGAAPFSRFGEQFVDRELWVPRLSFWKWRKDFIRWRHF